MRKSFVIYIDSLAILDELSDEQAGKLFKAIKNYHCGGDEPDNFVIKIAFAPFKSQFARDEQKYQSVIERNRVNGQKGGRPVKQYDTNNPDEPKKPSGLFENPKNPDEPKKADSDNDSVSDNDSDSDSEKEKENISEKNETRFSDEKPQNNISIITSENPAESKQQKKQSAAELYQADCKELVVMINDLFKKSQASGRPVTKKYHNLANEFYEYWSAKKGNRAFYAKKETFVINLRFKKFCKNAGLTWPPPLYEPPKMIEPKVMVDVEPLLNRKHTMDAAMLAEYDRDMAIMEAGAEAGLLYYEKKDESDD